LHRKIQAGIKIHSILETVTAYMLSWSCHTLH
jgi:hypothetical protein